MWRTAESSQFNPKWPINPSVWLTLTELADLSFAHPLNQTWTLCKCWSHLEDHLKLFSYLGLLAWTENALRRAPWNHRGDRVLSFYIYMCFFDDFLASVGRQMNDEHWETPWFVQGGVSKHGFPSRHYGWRRSTGFKLRSHSSGVLL